MSALGRKPTSQCRPRPAPPQQLRRQPRLGEQIPSAAPPSFPSRSTTTSVSVSVSVSAVANAAPSPFRPLTTTQPAAGGLPAQSRPAAPSLPLALSGGFPRSFDFRER